MLQKAKFKPEWELVRQSSVQFDTNGRLHANPWVSEMFADAVPVVQRFQDDLSHLKIRVSYMLATLDKEDTIQNNPTQSWDTPSAQLLTVLKVINSMSTWAVEVQDSWVTYHMTRFFKVKLLAQSYRIRFVPYTPPSISFCTKLACGVNNLPNIMTWVRLGLFLGRALRSEHITSYTPYYICEDLFFCKGTLATN